MNWRFSAGVTIALFILGVAGYLVYHSGTVPFFRGREQTLIDTEDVVVPFRSPSATPTPVATPPLSLERIFVTDHSWVKQLPAGGVVNLVATGDVILGRSVNAKMMRLGNFRWPFAKTVNLLESADLTVINLEAPLVSGCLVTVEGMTFCGDPKGVEGLVFAGVDVATLANNHAGDYGVSGISETKRVLTEAGILPVSENPTYKEVKGLRFTFLAYNDIGGPKPGVPWVDVGEVLADIREAKDQSDVVAVSFHWGVEYTREPTSRQRELAHLAVDAGADLILGNHPHWIQPVEIYQGKVIAYAHGNFVFDQMWSPETREGVVGRYVFFDKKLVDVEFIPVVIEDYGQPRILAGEHRQRVLNRLRDISLTMP